MTYSLQSRSLLLLLLLTTACSGNVKESLGIERQGPDAFNVVARPPLSLPPEFSLRVPAAPGSQEGLGTGQDKQAQAIITGQPVPNADQQQAIKDLSGLSGGEGALLEQAGATAANDAIRTQLMKEKLENPDTQTWLEKSVPILAGEKKDEDELDPTDEIKRLRASDKANAVTIPEKNLPSVEKKQ